MTQRPHHLSTIFGQHQRDVVYIDAHRTHKTNNTRMVSDNVKEVFLKYAQYMCFKNNQLRTHRISSCIAAMQPDMVIVNAPYWADVAILLKQTTGCRIIYDILDHFEGFEDLAAMGERITIAHNDIIANADIISHTAHNLRPEHHNTLYLPNACNYYHWNKPRKPGGNPGYFGSVAHWFDHDALHRMKIDIMGPGSRKGIVPYNEIPKYASKWGCGVIPFKDLQLTRSTNPVKFYEYMALGLPIVATDLDEMRCISDSMPEDIRPYLVKSGQKMNNTVMRAIEEDTEELIEKRKKWAFGQTWEHRYAALNDMIYKLRNSS